MFCQKKGNYSSHLALDFPGHHISERGEGDNMPTQNSLKPALDQYNLTLNHNYDLSKC